MNEETDAHRAESYKQQAEIEGKRAVVWYDRCQEAEEREKVLRDALEEVKERQEKIKDSNVSQETVTWHIADNALKAPSQKSAAGEVVMNEEALKWARKAEMVTVALKDSQDELVKAVEALEIAEALFEGSLDRIGVLGKALGEIRHITGLDSGNNPWVGRIWSTANKALKTPAQNRAAGEGEVG